MQKKEYFYQVGNKNFICAWQKNEVQQIYIYKAPTKNRVQMENGWEIRGKKYNQGGFWWELQYVFKTDVGEAPSHTVPESLWL